VVTCLSTYYMCTKFQRNLTWVVIFHVEHLWNDPCVLVGGWGGGLTHAHLHPICHIGAVLAAAIG